jgi:hypothetical protein
MCALVVANILMIAFALVRIRDIRYDRAKGYSGVNLAIIAAFTQLPSLRFFRGFQ